MQQVMTSSKNHNFSISYCITHAVHGGEWFTVVLHGMQAFDQHNNGKYHYITVLEYQWTVFIHRRSSESFHFIVLFWTALAQTIYCARFGVPSVLLTALHNEKNRQSLDWFVWKPRLTDCPSSKPLTLMELQRSQIETWQVRTDIPAPPPGALGMTDACVANHQQSNRLIFRIEIHMCWNLPCSLVHLAILNWIQLRPFDQTSGLLQTAAAMVMKAAPQSPG